MGIRKGVIKIYQRVSRMFKSYVQNDNRGVKEIDENLPSGHSGKAMAVLQFAGAPPVAGVTIPVNYEAHITKVDWDVTVAPLAGDTYMLLDNQATPERISIYSLDSGDNPEGQNVTRRGNGSGVIGTGRGTINVTAILGNWPTGECRFEYYLRRYD